ncbi:MAG: DUF2142 domain-containing protein [Thermoanaerobaculia bacterium]
MNQASSGASADKREPWTRTSLALGLLFSFSFALLTPPSQAPDEPGHFRRAYQISEGRLIARSASGTVGDRLPESVVRVSHDLLSGINLRPERKQDPSKIWEAFRVRLEPERRTFISFPAAAVYGFVAYVPQAVAMAVGRQLTDSVLVLFYLGRLANALCGALLLALAVRRSGTRPDVFFLVGLLPMTVFLMGSQSADCVTTGLAFVLTACLLFDEPVRSRMPSATITTWGALATLLSLTKPGYFLLSGLVLLAPTRRFGSAGRRAVACTLVVGGAFAAAGMWAWVVSDLHAPTAAELNARPADQWAWIRSHPPGFVVHVAGEMLRQFPRLAAEFVGTLGWLDVRLPLAIVVAHGLLLVVVASTGGQTDCLVGLWRKFALGALLLGSVLIIYGALFVYSSAAGSSRTGLQGRYFLPLAPAALLALGSRRWNWGWKDRFPLLATWTTFVLVVALILTVRRYYHS